MKFPWSRKDCRAWKWLHFWSDVYKFKWKLIHFKRRFFPVKVVETYEGRVSLFEDGIGYVTLKEMSTGQDFIAECPEFRLKRHGILAEGIGFTLRVIELSPEITKLEYEPRPLIRISKEEQDRIRRETEEALEGLDLTGNY